MSNKEKVIEMIDNIPENKMAIVLDILSNLLVEEVEPLPDEIEAIKRADESIAKNGTIPHEAINWD